jgi:CheY-like chemotaxis protein
LIPVLPLEASDVQVTLLRSHVTGLAPGQATYRLLVVDDKEVNRKLLVRILAPLGFEVEQARNGQEALEIWETWHPHLIWMDMRMPVMDGYEATRRIKATLKGQATVIIALTASALDEDRKVILSEGCDDYIRKPFHDQELFDALAKHLGVRFITADLESALSSEDEAATLEGAETGQPLAHKIERQPVDLASRMEKIPPEIIEALRQVALLGSLDEIMIAISQIRQQDAILADILQSWAEDFKHEKILALIGKTGGNG